jgi:hypothetical protein
MPKGYWIACGQFLKVIGKPLGNTQITHRYSWQMFPLAGCDEKSMKLGCQPIGEK